MIGSRFLAPPHIFAPLVVAPLVVLMAACGGSRLRPDAGEIEPPPGQDPGAGGAADAGAEQDAEPPPEGDASGGGRDGRGPTSDAGSGPGGEAPPAPVQGDYKPCPIATQVGEFRIELGEDATDVQGRVADGVVEAEVPEQLQAGGACRLLQRRDFRCMPGCRDGQSCGPGGKCTPLPVDHSVGTVAIAGLAAPVAMVPSEPGNLYAPARPLPHPGFREGAEIQLSAEGGDWTPFMLAARGVAPLRVPPGETVVEVGKPVTVAWEPAARPGLARVEIVLDINRNGGGQRAWIECHVPDSGSFTIPEGLVVALFQRGLSGYPAVTLTRRTVDSGMISPGCVQLVVASPVERAVKVPGLISCMMDLDCPEAQFCEADMTCK